MCAAVSFLCDPIMVTTSMSRAQELCCCHKERYYSKINFLFVWWTLSDSIVIVVVSFLFLELAVRVCARGTHMWVYVCLFVRHSLFFPPIRLLLSTNRSFKNPWHMNRMGNHHIDTFALLSYILSSNLTNLCSSFYLVPLLLSAYSCSETMYCATENEKKNRFCYCHCRSWRWRRRQSILLAIIFNYHFSASIFIQTHKHTT